MSHTSGTISMYDNSRTHSVINLLNVRVLDNGWSVER